MAPPRTSAVSACSAQRSTHNKVPESSSIIRERGTDVIRGAVLAAKRAVEGCAIVVIIAPAASPSGLTGTVRLHAAADESARTRLGLTRSRDIVHYRVMLTTTLSGLRNDTKKYFDAVERGETVEIFRNGKPVAILSPYVSHSPARWQHARPLQLKGVSLSAIILDERADAK